MARVLLFDVDGTLVHAGGAGRRSLERALGEHVGELDGALADIRLDGMTDRLIVREALAAMGRPFEDALCDRVLETYVGILRVEIRAPAYRVLPGVPGLLDGLRRRGVSMGLCTGNVAEGARIKLARGGLDGYFEWSDGAICGFAADGESRERIVAAALRRASARLGRPVAPAEALVIGDTPRDVEAARHAGVPVLAVATGHYTVEDLTACGADRVVPSLEGPEVASFLAGWPGPA